MYIFRKTWYLKMCCWNTWSKDYHGTFKAEQIKAEDTNISQLDIKDHLILTTSLKIVSSQTWIIVARCRKGNKGYIIYLYCYISTLSSYKLRDLGFRSMNSKFSLQVQVQTGVLFPGDWRWCWCGNLSVSWSCVSPLRLIVIRTSECDPLPKWRICNIDVRYWGIYLQSVTIM